MKAGSATKWSDRIEDEVYRAEPSGRSVALRSRLSFVHSFFCNLPIAALLTGDAVAGSLNAVPSLSSPVR
jgi:hypothetical protein